MKMNKLPPLEGRRILDSVHLSSGYFKKDDLYTAVLQFIEAKEVGLVLFDFEHTWLYESTREQLLTAYDRMKELVGYDDT